MIKKKIQKILMLALVFFSWNQIALAGFEISEIMYDLDGTDTNREWVEVHNTGNESLDLSKWFLFSDNTKHALAPVGASQVPAGSYAVIAQNVGKFQIDWPNYSGLLFDSSWTGFDNDGDTISLKDLDLNVISPVTYASTQGGGGDGNSLQKIGSNWIGALPTPGTANQTVVNTNTTSPESSGSSTVPAQKTATKKEVEIPKITTNILTKNIVFAGLPFSVNSSTFGFSKEPLLNGKFIWNFGDGTSTEFKEQKEFKYTYIYPGEYVVTLSYYRYYFSDIPDATDRVIIKVIPSELSVNSVGDNSDPYIELENKSTYEIDLSGWGIRSQTRFFRIPDGTVILPKNKLKFSPHTTGMNQTDLQSITILNSSGEIFTTYPVIVAKSEIKSATQQVQSKADENNYKSTITANTSKDSSVIDLNELGASANKADSKISNKTLAIIGLIFIVVIGILSTVILRKRNRGDELEHKLKASDITILE